MLQSPLRKIFSVAAIVGACLYGAGCAVKTPEISSNTSSPLAQATILPSPVAISEAAEADVTCASQQRLSAPTLAPCATRRPHESDYESSGSCDKDGCLFRSLYDPDRFVGFATIRGYYTTTTRPDWGGKEVICDNFVVVNGPKEMLDGWIRMVDAGNGLSRKNDLNQPIINLDMIALGKVDERKVKASSAERSIEIQIVSLPPRPMGAPSCYASVDIVNVN